MKLQLNSIDQAPPRLPPWQAIMEDLAYPPAPRVARVLGMSERSVYRFNQSGDAPRVASLALFWLTRWGRSSVHAQATTDAIRACGYAESLRRDVARLEARIEHLLTLANSGAANEPLLGGPRG